MRLVRLLVFASAALISFDTRADAQVPAPRAIEIRLVSDSDPERQARAQLERILARWDLSKWYFTRAVQIEAGVTPHSHPVLTLNTNGLANDTIKAVSFVHEQLHWFLSRHHAATDSAIADLRLRYADAPTEDAGDRESTYLHLLVGVLEFNATQELFGQGWARERLGKVPFYTWVYREIRERPEPIRQILKKHGLDSPDART